MENIERNLEKERIDMEEPKDVYYKCDRCGADICKGEDYYSYDRDCLCEDCFNEIQKDEKFEARRIAGDDDDY